MLKQIHTSKDINTHKGLQHINQFSSKVTSHSILTWIRTFPLDKTTFENVEATSYHLKQEQVLPNALSFDDSGVITTNIKIVCQNTVMENFTFILNGPDCHTFIILMSIFHVSGFSLSIRLFSFLIYYFQSRLRQEIREPTVSKVKHVRKNWFHRIIFIM